MLSLTPKLSNMEVPSKPVLFNVYDLHNHGKLRTTYEYLKLVHPDDVLYPIPGLLISMSGRSRWSPFFASSLCRGWLTTRNLQV